MKTNIPSAFSALVLTLAVAVGVRAPAQVVLVEPGHTVIQHVDSAVGLHPSQRQLDLTMPVGDIESIAIDPVTGDLFVQLIVPAGSAPSVTTHIFRVAAGGVVTPVALNTGLGINERGTDMHYDTVAGQLVTMDDAVVPGRLAAINVATGAIGTYSTVAAPIFGGATFGMDFSRGNPPGAAVPAGDICFTGDVMAAGIHSVSAAAPFTSTVHMPGTGLPGGGAGDDMVVQPDGDWIWVGDFTNSVTQVSPVPPHPAVPSAFSIGGLAAAAGLPFTAGSRAAVCDATGDVYVSYSGMPGGSGIWRIDETLSIATLVLTVGLAGVGDFIQDLTVGPATIGVGNSVYFTVHNAVTNGEEVWECTATSCCPVAASTVAVPDPGGLNARASIGPFPAVARPTLGNVGFQVLLDEPSATCPITPGSPTTLLIGFTPGTFVFPGFGCLPGAPGDVQIGLVPAPFSIGPRTWAGPGVGAVHPLPIPLRWDLCGSRIFLQGVWLDLAGVAGPAILSQRLDVTIGG